MILSNLLVLFCILKGLQSFSLNNFENILGPNIEKYVFTSISTDDTNLPEIGNGHIATQVKNQYLFMNGIYNGAGINSHRACIPSTINWNVSSGDDLQQTFYSLNSVIGVFEEKLIYKQYNISMSSYISRVSRQILVRNISLESGKHSRSVILNTAGTIFDRNSLDFDFSVQDLGNELFINGSTKIPENVHTTRLPIFIILEKVPKQIILNDSRPWISFITSLDSKEPGAVHAYNNALATKSLLLSDHIQGWFETWNDGLIVVSSPNDFVSKSVHAAQYYLLSSLPYRTWAMDDNEWLFYGLSPTGLAHGNTLDDYLGHVFWDMETWMFPVILPFHNSLTMELVKYRRFMLDAARNNSKISGNKGARYPWESARTGYETTYDPIVGRNEIHITSDISFAIQEFLWINSKHQSQLYYDLSKDMIISIAEYWASRVTFNKTRGKYEILDVMPPDEYVNSCNNSAYTNIAAIKSLEAPLILAKRYQDNVTENMQSWLEISRNIFYPYDEKSNFMFEFEGYRLGTTSKQADVVLLQYPFQFYINKQCAANNLNYYANVTDPNGPAMTWSIFSINWFNLNDSLQAERYFNKNFDYITTPYYVWSEIKNGNGAKNFLTGIGGYLQNILYGYIGMRLNFVDDGQLVFDPTTTVLINGIKLHNITFQSSNIDINVDDVHLSVKLIGGNALDLMAMKDKRKYKLNSINNEIKISKQMIAISTSLKC